MSHARFLVRFWMSHFDKPVMVYPGYEQYTLELVRDLWNNELTPGIIPMQCTGLHDKTTWEELRDAEKRDYLERVPGRTAKEWPGRLIWEGDILAAHNHNWRMVVRQGGYDNGESYDAAVSGYGFYLIEKKIKPERRHDPDTKETIEAIDRPGYAKVIGNIWQNPELFKTEAWK